MKSLTPFHSLMAFRLMSIGKQRCVVGPDHAFNADPNRRAFGPGRWGLNRPGFFGELRV
jgi:hypothetical protein